MHFSEVFRSFLSEDSETLVCIFPCAKIINLSYTTNLFTAKTTANYAIRFTVRRDMSLSEFNRTTV